MPLIGVEVVKHTLMTTVHANGVKPPAIANTPSAIKAWLRTLPAHRAIAMESTGKYQRELASLAHTASHNGYVLNAMDVFHYGKALGQRGKTDRPDAILLAQYLPHHQGHLRLWQPTPAHLLHCSLCSKAASTWRM
jgi:transposase